MNALIQLVRTTTFRLSLIFLLVFLVVGAAAVFSLGRYSETLLRAQLRETVEADVAGLVDQYRTGGLRGLTDALQRRSLQPDANLYLLTDFSGRPLAGNVRGVPAFVLAEERWVDTDYGTLGAGGRFDETALIKVSILPSEFRLLVGRDLGQTRAVHDIVRSAGLWAMLGFGGLWLLVGLAVSRRVLTRVDAMAETSRAIMAGDMQERIPVKGVDDELDNLAVSLNAMLERIDRLMRGLKDVSDNIAHDLKTPITRLRNRAEETMRTAETPDEFRAGLTELTDEVDGIIRVFNALLLIARAEAGNVQEAFAPVDPARIAHDVAELHEPSASERGLTIVVDAPEATIVRANRELIGQALSNLIDNAIHHSGAEARRIAVSVDREGGDVLLRVADDGAGIDASDRDKALTRFERLGATGGGSGLGLSLVRAISHLHGGDVTLRDAAPGLAVEMRLPAS